ncbi:hypothetical protein [Burkholderia pyrrocinia]
MNNFPSVNHGSRPQLSNYGHVTQQQSLSPDNQRLANSEQQNSNRNQPSHPLAPPYTLDVLGGKAKFQPIPSATFSPRTYATLAASVTPVPGGPSLGVSGTARFDPQITLRATDAGGVNVNFAPNMQVEVSGNLNLGVPNILGTGVGVNLGGSGTQRFTFGGPALSLNVNPDGAFNFNADFSPSIASRQILGVNGRLEGSVFGVGISGSQSISHEAEQGIKIGGPGIQYAVSSAGTPTISQNLDKTISITNNYTFAPRTGLDANAQAGPVRVNAGGAVTPTFTVQHKVTFSTDLASGTPPKHEFSAMPGVRLDGSVGFRVSLLPPDAPLSVSAEVGFIPRVTVSGPQGSYTRS